MDKERLITLLYNAIVCLEEYGCQGEQLEDDLGITKSEYHQIMDNYQDTICCTFGKEDKINYL